MEINEVSYQPGGVFTIDLIRGAKTPFMWGLRSKAIYKREGKEGIIHAYKKMGGVHEDSFDAKNRLVREGVVLIVSALAGGAPTLPSQLQLGSGGTVGVWNETWNAPVTPITSGGLAVATAAMSVTNGAFTGDTLTAYKDFTASADFASGSAPDEVIIRSTTPKCLAYAAFPSGERTLISGDHLLVTYNLRIVP